MQVSSLNKNRHNYGEIKSVFIHIFCPMQLIPERLEWIEIHRFWPKNYVDHFIVQNLQQGV